MSGRRTARSLEVAGKATPHRQQQKRSLGLAKECVLTSAGKTWHHAAVGSRRGRAGLPSGHA